MCCTDRQTPLEGVTTHEMKNKHAVVLMYLVGDVTQSKIMTTEKGWYK